MPPTEPPVIAKPVALARFAQNQCPTVAIAGVNKREVEMPPRT